MKKRWPLLAAITAMAVALLVILPSAFADVTTDMYVYQAGDTVHITGNGMASMEAVGVDVTAPDHSLAQNHQVAADVGGSFTDSYVLPADAQSGIYTVTATGLDSGTVMSTTFDPVPACNTPNPSSRPTSTKYSVTTSVSGNTATYSVNAPHQSTSGGIPGLIDLCVYDTSAPASLSASYSGWEKTSATSPFGYGRNVGSNNIPLDGTTEVGTATWSSGLDLSGQQIVLHISDQAECTNLYGAGASATCFVLPNPNTTPPAGDLTVTKDANPTYTRTYGWTIKKTVDPATVHSAGGGTSNPVTWKIAVTKDAGTDSGWAVSGTINVLNPNTFDVTGVNVTDATPGGTCSVPGGTSATIPEQSSMDFAYTCTFTSNPGSGTNTATATWPDIGSTNTSASGTAAYTFGDPTTVVNDTIHVTDTNGKSFTFSASGSETYTQTFTDPAGTCTDHTNTATITETGQTSSATATDCQGSDLTVSKTATPSYTRQYKWSIAKLVNTTHVNIPDGGAAQFDYTVSASHDSGTDSGWQVTGKITVNNPNDWESITADVSDAIDNGGVCTVTGGTGVSIPAGGSVTLDYSCTYASAPTKANGTNTASATWDKALYSTPSGSASGSAGANFTAPTTVVDDNITVTDSNVGTLGVANVSQANPILFQYTIFRAGVSGECTDYDNTATFTTDDTGTTGSAGQTVTVCVGKDLTVSKTAKPSYTRTYAWDIKKSADPTTVYSAGGKESAPASYTVSVTHDKGADSGWKVTGTITVTNPNHWEDITANVTDAIDHGGACTVTGGTDVVVPAGKSVDLSYTCTFTSNPGSGTNTAAATWDESVVSTPHGSASGSAGYTFGDPTTIKDGSVSVTDTLGGDLGTVSYTDPSPTTFSYALTFTDPAGTCTSHKNTATFTTDTTGTTGSDSATVKDCQGADLTVSKTVKPSYTRKYTWGIKKSVDSSTVYSAGGGVSNPANYHVKVTHDSGTDSGWNVSGTITVTNPNDWEDINVTPDDVLAGADCHVGGGVDVTVPAGQSVDFPYSCGFSSKPDYGTDLTNTASASWDGTAAHTPNSDASGTKTFQFSDPTKIVDGSVSVTDTFGGALGTVSYTDPSPTTFSYSKTFTDPAGTCTSHNNTATFTTNDTGATGSDSATVKDCQGADLTVSKTATPSFTRTYKWGITKNVDKSSVKLIGGGSATFNYTVTASHDSGTDGAWGVTGTITITNPNDWEAISLTSLSDTLNSSGACTLGEAGPYLVPASGSIQVDYTCATANASDTKNTATATWDSGAYSTPNGSASGNATVAFTTPTTLADNCVTVTDTFNGGSPVTMGTACVGGGWTKAAGNTLASFTESYAAPTFTFKYSRTISAPPAGTCVTYPNTAKFTTNTSGTTGSAGQSVTVCDYNAALTPGYWKNHLNLAVFPQTLGTYSVNTQAKATVIYNAMNCSSSTAQDAIGCLAGHLLSTEFNLANHSDVCIAPVVTKANNFLKGLVVDGVTGINYVGPSGTYSLTAAQRAEAITLKTALDKYNNGLGC